MKVKPECRHTLAPEGYLAWHEWAEKKSETHEQVQCPRCGLWAIWKPKRTAGAVEGGDGG